jgi:CHRD domain-containing protein
MSNCIAKGFVPHVVILFVLCCFACKKGSVAEEARIKPPVREYIVIARIDKKGTNSNSEGTAVLKGYYSEESKSLSYSLEYKDVIPQMITLRSGAKGSAGSFIKELYSREKERPATDKPIAGSLTLSPLQERNLLKGQWFVAVSTIIMSPEISGVLTLKQK